MALAAFLKQRAQSRGIFIYRYSPGMPACASRHAGTLSQPRGFCCLPINRLFRSAADSAALLIFSAHADFEDAPILFSLLFTAVSTRHLRHRNFRYRHLHFRSGSFPYSIRLPVPFRPPCLFVQLAGLTSDIAKGALLFSLSASVFFSATHRASDFRHKSSTDFLIIFSYLRKCWKGLLYQTFPAFCVSEDTPHIMAFRSLIWHWKVVKP